MVLFDPQGRYKPKVLHFRRDDDETSTLPPVPYPDPNAPPGISPFMVTILQKINVSVVYL
jgi:hypothetical protein